MTHHAAKTPEPKRTIYIAWVALLFVCVAAVPLFICDTPGLGWDEPAYIHAANRYLGFSEEPLVSIDYQGNPHSSVVDAISTKVIGNMVKILSWYDNEWGYSNRVLDLLLLMDAKKPL